MWSALGIISILHGKRQRARRVAGHTIVPLHGGHVVSPCLVAWSRSLNELPYGRCVRPFRIPFPGSDSPGPDSTQTGPRDSQNPPPLQIERWKWAQTPSSNFEGLLIKETDWGRHTEEKELFRRKETTEEREGGGRDANREKEEWWWEKERVKGRKWGERKWRGQVQQQSRWEEGKSDGVARSEGVEKLMSLLLFDGACLLQRQDAFLTFSFRDPVFFPVFSLYFFSTLSFPFLSPFLAFSLF